MFVKIWKNYRLRRQVKSFVLNLDSCETDAEVLSLSRERLPCFGAGFAEVYGDDGRMVPDLLRADEMDDWELKIVVESFVAAMKDIGYV